MSRELLLGIDIGTASAKAVLADPDGAIVACAARQHALDVPRPGWAEHDVERVWWDAVTSLCRQLLAQADGRAIAGVCVSGIGPCVALCDERLSPLRPAILYGIDTRASAEVEQLTERLGAERILARSGSALSSQALGPKLLWLRRHEPELWARSAGWYMASSLVVARLTGEYVLDHHSASQCDPLYDLAARDWAHDWAHEVCHPLPLPRLAWPWEPVGAVHAAGAEATGIPLGTPVMAGTIDAWAEAFSVGVRRPGDLMLMYGSTMFLVEAVAGAAPHPGLWTTAGIEPDSVTLAAGMATSGSLTGWVRSLTGDAPFAQLAEEAASVPSGARGLLALPYFSGERSPLFDPDARGVLAGLTLAHTRAEILRAVYEAIGFGIRHILETFADAAAAPQRVVAVGGGTTGSLWTRIVSDITGLTQELPAETIGAAYGDALLAAIGTGLVAPATDWTVPRETIAPDPATHDVYAELYELYRELHRSTAGIQHRLATLGERHAAAAVRT
jgi:xylulokinase